MAARDADRKAQQRAAAKSRERHSKAEAQDRSDQDRINGLTRRLYQAVPATLAALEAADYLDVEQVFIHVTKRGLFGEKYSRKQVGGWQIARTLSENDEVHNRGSMSFNFERDAERHHLISDGRIVALTNIPPQTIDEYVGDMDRHRLARHRDQYWKIPQLYRDDGMRAIVEGIEALGRRAKAAS